jgi:S-adenosyl methyltransferase
VVHGTRGAICRELAGRIRAAMPAMPLIARFACLFLADAVGRDPAVARPARSLRSTREGKTYYLQADLRDPEAILAAAGETLDLMPPGVVPASEWDLGEAVDTTIGGLAGYVGIGRKR